MSIWAHFNGTLQMFFSFDETSQMMTFESQNSPFSSVNFVRVEGGYLVKETVGEPRDVATNSPRHVTLQR